MVTKLLNTLMERLLNEALDEVLEVTMRSDTYFVLQVLNQTKFFKIISPIH